MNRNLHTVAGCAALLLAAGCSSVQVPIDDREGASLGRASLVADCAAQDVVFFGEIHSSDKVHAEQISVLEKLHQIRPDIIVTMEMFERDTQDHLDAYLSGRLPEEEFKKLARAWKNWHHYKPIVDFAKRHRLPVIAANAPVDLVRKVSRGGGLAAVQGEANVAQEVSTPRDAYFEAFEKAMSGHGPMSDEKVGLFYAAQCLRDDTMAESIANQLKAAHADGRRPLVYHLCGAMHSDLRRGTVDRLLRRMPDLRVRVITPKTDAVAWFQTAAGDFLLVAPDKQKRMMPTKSKSKGKGKADPHAKPVTKPVTKPEAAPKSKPKGKPGLAFKPIYSLPEGEFGVGVDYPIPGGVAEKAGIKAGDIIRAIDGEDLQDIRHYMEVIKEKEIGKKVKIVVWRDKKEVELEIEIGVSGR